eukprot:COSAG01_NODE_295_length_19292_cov_726.304538_8_plen_79_part_00
MIYCNRYPHCHLLRLLTQFYNTLEVRAELVRVLRTSLPIRSAPAAEVCVGVATQVSYLQPYELTPQDTPEQLAVDVRK